MLKDYSLLRRLVTIKPIKLLLVIIVCINFGLITPGIADIMSDFEKASKSKGKDAIPFQNLRKEVYNLNQEKKNYCKYVEQSISGVLPKKKQLIDKIEDTQELVKDLEEDKANGEDVDYKLESSKEDLEELLNDYNVFDVSNRVDENHDAAKKCLSIRKNEENLYNQALKDVDNVRYSPERHLDSNASDEDKKKLKGYAEDIIDILEDSIREHEQSIDDTERYIKNLEEILNTKL